MADDKLRDGADSPVFELGKEYEVVLLDLADVQDGGFDGPPYLILCSRERNEADRVVSMIKRFARPVGFVYRLQRKPLRVRKGADPSVDSVYSFDKFKKSFRERLALQIDDLMEFEEEEGERQSGP